MHVVRVHMEGSRSLREQDSRMINKGCEMSLLYPEGVDCVWMAADHRGYVGAFVTAGVGPIPTLVLDSKGIAIEEIEERIYGLPPVSEVHVLTSVPRPDDFVAMAKRGVFVYDWSDIHRTSRLSIGAYELMAAPETPITVNDLPSDMMQFVKDIKLNGVEYAEAKVIDVREYLESIAGE